MHKWELQNHVLSKISATPTTQKERITTSIRVAKVWVECFNGRGVGSASVTNGTGSWELRRVWFWRNSRPRHTDTTKTKKGHFHGRRCSRRTTPNHNKVRYSRSSWFVSVLIRMFKSEPVSGSLSQNTMQQGCSSSWLPLRWYQVVSKYFKSVSRFKCHWGMMQHDVRTGKSIPDEPFHHENPHLQISNTTIKNDIVYHHLCLKCLKNISSDIVLSILTSILCLFFRMLYCWWFRNPANQLSLV